MISLILFSSSSKREIIYSTLIFYLDKKIIHSILPITYIFRNIFADCCYLSILKHSPYFPKLYNKKKKEKKKKMKKKKNGSEYYRQIKSPFICTSATWKVITSLSSTDHHWATGRLNSCEGEPLHYFPIPLHSSPLSPWT